MPPREDADHIGRRTPAKGVVLSHDMPLILFCTVCSQERGTWVVQKEVMDVLHDLWLQEATAWLVGPYVLMPDHLHFLCCPRDLKEGFEVEKWVAFWKDGFAKTTRGTGWTWQRGVFHTRIRSDAHLQEKLDYIRDNPAVKKLVEKADDWPWRGRVHDLELHFRAFGNPAGGGG